MTDFNRFDSISTTILATLIFLSTSLFLRAESKLNPVLNINQTLPYLINKTSGHLIEPRDYMDFENLYSPNEAYKSNQTAQARNYYMLKAFDFANYFQSDYWHYSNEQDLKLSAFPVANEQKCAHQLNWLVAQLNQSGILFRPGEQHVNLASYVDSFGKPEAGTYFGHGYWLGSYYECNKISIDMRKFEKELKCQANLNNHCDLGDDDIDEDSIIRTRYCMGKAREIDWPNYEEDNYVPRISYKVGLCLPEVCETLSIKKHRIQIEKLMQYNLPDYMRSRIYLDDMYCLPDKRSPIRSFSLSASIFIAITGVWLLILLIATVLYSCLKGYQKDLRSLAKQVRAAEREKNLQIDLGGRSNNEEHKSLDNNALLKVRLPESNNSPKEDKSISCRSYLVNYMICSTTRKREARSILPPAELASNQALSASENPFVSTNRHQDTHDSDEDDTNDDNHLDLTHMKHQPYKIDNRSESSFYSTSSSLTGWLNGSPFITKSLQALSITENMIEFQQPPSVLKNADSDRKLRINLNALDAIKCLCCILVIFGHIVFIHMQHLVNIVHTIELSYDVAPRFLIAFFNFVDTFFIISGMLTAYFVFKRFNKRTFANPINWILISLFRLIRLSSVYVFVFWFVKTITVYLSDGPIWDYGTDKNSIKGLCMNDHWWKSILYLGNVGTMQPLCILPAWSIILDAQYSLIIPPILFLIFKYKRFGYLCLLFAIVISTVNMSYQLATQTAVKTSDMAKVRLHVYPLISRFAAEFYNTAWNRIGPVAVGILGGHMLYLYDIGQVKQWPWFMRRAAFKFILLLHLIIFILPTIGHYTESPTAPTGNVNPKQQDSDLAVFVLSNATIKPIWSIINTIFLLRLITDLRTYSIIARLMSHNIWHCLGKLCFASYLIHYEIILVLLKSRQEGLLDPNWWNVVREFSVAFLISTLIAYLVYILIEAPVNKLIMLNVNKSKFVSSSSNESNDKTQPGHSSSDRQAEDLGLQGEKQITLGCCKNTSGKDIDKQDSRKHNNHIDPNHYESHQDHVKSEPNGFNKLIKDINDKA